MDWLANSIMHRRGVARSAVGATHELSEATQGANRYTGGVRATGEEIERAAGLAGHALGDDDLEHQRGLRWR